jgi:hypothetical protein
MVDISAVLSLQNAKMVGIPHVRNGPQLSHEILYHYVMNGLQLYHHVIKKKKVYLKDTSWLTLVRSSLQNAKMVGILYEGNSLQSSHML